jgi:hypothetical protein
MADRHSERFALTDGSMTTRKNDPQTREKA